MEEGLYSLLTGDAGVSALVSTRVYPLAVPQQVDLPAVAYQRISGPRLLAHDGPTGLAEARVQVTCHAATYIAAKGLADAVRAAVDGYAGTTGGVEFERIGIESEVDGYAETYERATVRLDLTVCYLE